MRRVSVIAALFGLLFVPRAQAENLTFQPKTYSYKAHIRQSGQQKVFKGFDLSRKGPQHRTIKIIGSRRALAGARCFTADYVEMLQAHGAYNVKEVKTVKGSTVLSFSARRGSPIDRIQKTATKLAKKYPDQRLDAIQARPVLSVNQPKGSVPTRKSSGGSSAGGNSDIFIVDTYASRTGINVTTNNAAAYAHTLSAGSGVNRTRVEWFSGAKGGTTGRP